MTTPARPKPRSLRIGELCAGYGGLGMAVEEVFDAELAWVSEFDEAPSRILAHHWPDVPNYGDMTKIDWAAVEPVDIISGGTPCQDLSGAGRRKGMTEGTRSNLWVQMREAIATIKPTYVVWENVRGAYSAGAYSEVELTEGRVGADGDPHLRALGRVLGDLSDLGYDCQWRGLRAADVGAPHGRFRVFILATKNPDPATGRERRLTASGQEEAGRSRTNSRGRSGTSIADAHSGECDGRECDQIRSPQQRAAVAWGGDVPAADASSAERGRQEPDHLGAGQDATAEPRERFSGDVAWGQFEPAIRRWESALGRRAPAPTEPTGRDGGHRLSARFTEWMMGVPDGWIVDVPGISRNEALKAAGNGVVPQQAAAALRDMLAAAMPLDVAA